MSGAMNGKRKVSMCQPTELWQVEGECLLYAEADVGDFAVGKGGLPCLWLTTAPDVSNWPDTVHVLVCSKRIREAEGE